MKLLLDPLMIWFSPYNNIEFQYLENTIDLISKLLNIKHIASDTFLLYLQKLIKEPFGNYRESESKKKQIISSLFKILDNENIVYLQDDDIITSSLPSEFNYTYNNDVNEYFVKIIDYLVRNSDIECILFLALSNHKIATTIGNNIHYIRHIYKEENSYLADLISNNLVIKNNSIIAPTLKQPLPNKWLTKEYNNIRINLIESGQSSIVAFLSLGKEVSLRNGYIFDKYLTQINNSAIREIFKSKTKPVIYLSTDVEHGAIEVFDYKPEHQGEFSYEGNLKPNSKDPIKHKIILHK